MCIKVWPAWNEILAFQNQCLFNFPAVFGITFCTLSLALYREFKRLVLQLLIKLTIS